MSTLELLQDIGICKDVAHLVIDYIHFRDQIQHTRMLSLIYDYNMEDCVFCDPVGLAIDRGCYSICYGCNISFKILQITGGRVNKYVKEYIKCFKGNWE